jgi:hypothetical protein
MYFQTFAIGEYPVGESLIGEIRESPNFNANQWRATRGQLVAIATPGKIS